MSETPPPLHPEETLLTGAQWVTIRPGRCGGRPCLIGSRIDAYWVITALARGDTTDAILRRYGNCYPRAAIEEIERLWRELPVETWGDHGEYGFVSLYPGTA